jgi:hypothetical protein
LRFCGFLPFMRVKRTERMSLNSELLLILGGFSYEKF